MRARRRRHSVGVVDLAEELGVSTATVSRALNGNPSVRPELAEKIQEYAERRGYVANRLARALSASTSRAFVGFIIPYVDTPAYSLVAAECARLLSVGGTQLILTITENDPERELQQLREMAASRTAGVMIAPSTHVLDGTRRILADMPTVELHRTCGIEVPGVFSDDEQTIVEAVAHLAELGHTNIGYVGTPLELSNGMTRVRGVQRGMSEAGFNGESMAMKLVEPTRENGREAILELLREHPETTAIIIGSGSLSVGATEAVRLSGRRVPDDLSLIVYGDRTWFALSDPPLTLIEVDYAALARRAARLLLRSIDSRITGEAPPPAEPHLVAPRLQIAGSTGTPHDRADSVRAVNDS